MSTVVNYSQARLGAEFSIAGLSLSLSLSDVAPTANPQAFSLTFQGPAEPPLRQQTFALERAADEALAVLIVPASRNRFGVQCHAVFNN